MRVRVPPVAPKKKGEFDMEEGREIKRAPWWVYGIFGLVLMFFNLGLYKVMSGDFTGFTLLAFIMNILLGVGFRNIYHTITKERG